ncbi:MAG: dihydrolipoyl dehydrogenase [Parachlamydiaceae bacterium]
MKYDVVVIGSGPGGYVAAIRASQLGFKVACIEKNKSLGGTCLNIGCIPSKALLYSTEIFHLLDTKGKKLGIQSPGMSFEFSTMMQRKEQVVKASIDGVDYLFKKNDVSLIHGEATLVENKRIKVNNDLIEAEHIILATGSEPMALPFLPFDGERVVSSTEMLSLPAVPKRLGVIGGGVIGVELASVYHRLGSEVTMIEMLPEICSGIDLTIAKQLHKSLISQGMRIHTDTRLKEGVVTKGGVALKATKSKKDLDVEVDVLLVAIGRKPFSQRLGLDNAKIGKDSKGFIQIKANFETTHPGIYAIGDLVEGPMLAHKASEEGVAVAEVIAGLNPFVDYSLIPNIIYTHPEVATVGLSEEEALRENLEIFVGSCPLKFNPRARCIDEGDGLVKVIGEKRSGRIIGMHLFCAQASELIVEGMLAIKKQATVEELANSPNGHPTLSEAIKEACLAALKRPINF